MSKVIYAFMICKIFVAMAVIVMAVSCKNEYESNLQKMELAAKKYVEDVAFKSNATIDFLEFKAVSYEPVDENHIDTLISLQLVDKVLSYHKKMRQSTERMKNSRDLIKIYASIDRSIALDEYKEWQVDSTRARLYMDSAAMCLSKDTAIRERIKSRVNPKVFYSATFFIKATSKNNKSGASENYMDSIHMYFDENINVFEIPTPTL
jgi:hypothetical protein